MPLVQRDVPGIRRFEIGKHAVAIAAVGDVSQQRAANALVLRRRVDAEPTNQTICHCTMCRHAAGAPSVAWFSVPPDSVRFVAGEPQRFKSSEHATRSFCPDCGTTLTYQSTRTPGDLDITTCSLDEPEQVPPRDHTFARSKLSWVTIADGLPAWPTTRP